MHMQSRVKMKNAYAVEGPAFLQPAAMRVVLKQLEKQHEEKKAAAPKSYLHVEQKLTAGYKEDKFEVMRQGDPALEGSGITIMVQRIFQSSAAASQPSTSTAQPAQPTANGPAEDPMDIDEQEDSLVEATSGVQDEDQDMYDDEIVVSRPARSTAAQETSARPTMSQSEVSQQPTSTQAPSPQPTVLAPAVPAFAAPQSAVSQPAAAQPAPPQPRIPRMLAGLSHSKDNHGVNPNLPPPDADTYVWTNGVKYAVDKHTDPLWLLNDRKLLERARNSGPPARVINAAEDEDNGPVEGQVVDPTEEVSEEEGVEDDDEAQSNASPEIGVTRFDNKTRGFDHGGPAPDWSTNHLNRWWSQPGAAEPVNDLQKQEDLFAPDPSGRLRMNLDMKDKAAATSETVFKGWSDRTLWAVNEVSDVGEDEILVDWANDPRTGIRWDASWETRPRFTDLGFALWDEFLTDHPERRAGAVAYRIDRWNEEVKFRDGCMYSEEDEG